MATKVSSCIEAVIFALIISSITKLAHGESDTKHGLLNYFKSCRLSSPDLQECIKENIMSLKPKLVNGIPELGIPQCEPIVLESLEFNNGHGAISVKSSYSDVYIWGATNFNIQSIDIDVESNTARIQMNFPRLYLEANYQLEGKVLMLPINGSGFSKANYTNIDATIYMQFEKERKHDGTYVQCNDMAVFLKIGGVQIHLSNLFNGNKKLGDAANKFLNKSSATLAEEVRPALQTMVSDLFKDLTNKLCEQQPIDTVLIE